MAVEARADSAGLIPEVAMTPWLGEQQVLSHPIVQALDPNRRDFVRVRWLSPRLNPYAARGIRLGCAVTFLDGLPHIKAVAAYGMLMDELRRGNLHKVHTLVVPSSGNTADAVARLAPAFGIERVKLFMSSDVPATKRNLIAALASARVISPEAGKGVEAAAREEADLPGHHLLDQYGHGGNVAIHEACTGPRLLEAAGGRIDIVAVGMGSAGTVTGVSRHLKAVAPETRVVGVRPAPGERIPGMRDKAQMAAAVTIPWQQAIDALEEVTEKPAFIKTRELWSEVEPRPGPSSGAAFLGLLQYLQRLDAEGGLDAMAGASVVSLCPDDGRFYSDQIIRELDPDQGKAY